MIFDRFYSIQQVAPFELSGAGVVGKAVGQRRYSRSLFQRYSLTNLCCLIFPTSAIREGDGEAEHIIRCAAQAIRFASSGSQSANEMLLNWVRVMMLRNFRSRGWHTEKVQ